MSVPEAIVFIGLQGAGKTTYYHKHFAATHAHISVDLQGSVDRQRAALEQALSAGKPLVLDNTNVTRAARAPFIARAKAGGYRVVAVFFDIQFERRLDATITGQTRSQFPCPPFFALPGPFCSLIFS